MALAIYVALVECANDACSESFEVPQKAIAAGGMVGVEVLERYTPELEQLGLVHVESGKDEGRPNTWTLTDPPAQGTPSGHVPLGTGPGQVGGPGPAHGGGTPSGHVLLVNKEKKGKKGSTSSDVEPDAHTRTVDQDSLPAGFPEALAPTVGAVRDVLCRVQAERGGHVPTLRGVALAVRRCPDRDHVQVAGELEHWATVGNGRNRPVKDWPRQYSAFLDRSPASTPSRASGVGDERHARRARRSAALSGLMSPTPVDAS